MSRERLYPPDWVDDEEAGYLLRGASTFRDYVSRGYFPSGVKIGGKRLWSRASINDALEKLANPARTSPVDNAIKSLIEEERTKTALRRAGRQPAGHSK